MTTAPDPDGASSNTNVPYLPPARAAPPHEPVAPEPSSPMPEPSPSELVVPGSPSSGPALPEPANRGAGDSVLVSAPPPGSGASTGGSDASAVVSVPRRPANEPVYGSLPTVADGDDEASRRLRSEAQRRRRRNARIGWVLAVALFGTAVVAGWVVYRAFDEESDTSPDAPAADVRGETASEGNTDDGAEAQAAAADEQPAVDSYTSSGSAPSDERAAELAGSTIDRPDYRTLQYDVRVSSGIEPDAPYRHFTAVYDVVADDYFGLFEDSATRENSIVSFDGDWRYEVGSDGIHRRVRRSKFSLQPEPDTLLAELLVETDVLPVSARPFATLVSEEPDDDNPPAADGTPGTIVAYQLDVDAFRAADPAAHAAWRSLWSTALPDSVDLIVPGSEQVQLREVTPLDVLRDRDPVDFSSIEVEAASGLTAVVFRVTERGVVDRVRIVSPEDDARVLYVASEYDVEASSYGFDGDGIWVDAP